jgi:hypothetical protein
MRLGSDMEQTAHEGEYRTPEDVRLLFERYRAEARHFAEIADDEPLRRSAGGGTRTPTACATGS